MKSWSASNSRQSSAKTARDDLHAPNIPQLRALQQEMSETSLSGNSSPSTPRSGQNRPHPHSPVGEDSIEISYEVVSSLASQAPCATGTDNSAETTPIRRSASSPMLSPPIQGEHRRREHALKHPQFRSAPLAFSRCFSGVFGFLFLVAVCGCCLSV